jgi:hypothetical protein
MHGLIVLILFSIQSSSIEIKVWDGTKGISEIPINNALKDSPKKDTI